MFEDSGTPGVFGLPPGSDFAREFVAGLMGRFRDAPPASLARTTILTNTARMKSSIVAQFLNGPAQFLPKIELISDFAIRQGLGEPGRISSPLERRLQLTQLAEALIRADPTVAPVTSAPDLALSLVRLLDEMEDEGVSAEAFEQLDTGQHAEHWQRSLRFLKLIGQFSADGLGIGPNADRRLATRRLIDVWAENPPTHPVIVAGSTGSRSSTAMLMSAVASLPSGAVVLPGFDFDLPDHVWRRFGDEDAPEDHPQFRFHGFMEGLNLGPGDVRSWMPDEPEKNARAHLVSLALRPASVTSQWRQEGPALGALEPATQGLSLIEAPSPRYEAAAIALRLRAAIEHGESAALITPDREIARRVTAALDRWGLTPDDSAGRPFALSATGRLLVTAGNILLGDTEFADVIAALKHPLVASADGERGNHLLNTRELEIWGRRSGQRDLTHDALRKWRDRNPEQRKAWADWVARNFCGPTSSTELPLEVWIEQHKGLVEDLAGGSSGQRPDQIWADTEGEQALSVFDAFLRVADVSLPVSGWEYLSHFRIELSGRSVRETVAARPGLMIWGTLEARVQSADLIILAGLNEGIWPEAAPPDPWLNRSMRKEVGLLSPERSTGLSAHDFQQAVCAKTVVITRSMQVAGAQFVPSRWLNRLLNLLDGLPATGGPEALAKIRARGDKWLRLATRLEDEFDPIPGENRPNPAPPARFRPKRLSVTDLQKLVRDPYAIYARRVLGLRPLEPIRPQPDGLLRGVTLHRVMERFTNATTATGKGELHQSFRNAFEDCLREDVPWPAAREIWRHKLVAVANWIVESEIERRSRGQAIATERSGLLTLSEIGVEISGTADRMDRAPDGSLMIYDYKSGAIPSAEQIEFFDKQLLIERLMAEEGAFDDIDAAPVSMLAYIGIGGTAKEQLVKDTPEVAPARIREELISLLSAYHSEDKGYLSRRAMEKVRYDYGYDHLVRLGEWDESARAPAQPVGRS